ELFPARGSGGHGDGAGSESAGAGDVTGSVADHGDVGGGEVLAEDFEGAPPRDGAEFVAVVVVVAEGPGGEMPIDAEMAQLDPGTLAQVSGEDGEAMMTAFLEGGEQALDAGKKPSPPLL